VVGEQHTLRAREALEDLGGRDREVEARHHVRHRRDAVAVDRPADGSGIGLGADRRGDDGMCVIDEFVRRVGVRQRLDRRIRCGRVEQILAEVIDEFFVRELGPADFEQRREP
jgi:hypothetical protein